MFVYQVVSKARSLKREFDAARGPKMEPNPDYGLEHRSVLLKIYMFYNDLLIPKVEL